MTKATSAAVPLALLALCTVALVPLRGRGAPQPVEAPGGRPPVAPESIVNICDPKPNVVALPDGEQGTVIYKVPAESWLVMTDAQKARSTALTLLEIRNGRCSRKLHLTTGREVGPVGYHSAVGIAFAPGSEVAARSVDGDLNLTGYLVPR